MPENILEKIITKKTEKIEKLKKTITSESLNDLIKTNIPERLEFNNGYHPLPRSVINNYNK